MTNKKMKNEKSNVVLIVTVTVILVITVLVIAWMFNKKKQNQQQIMRSQKVQQQIRPIDETKFASEQVGQVFDKKVLQDLVFSNVNNELELKYKKTKDRGYETWDKKVDITSVDTSQKAAKGKWWAKDAWDWIAWQQDDNSWKVLLSFDGFNCTDLTSIPSQYDKFFYNIVNNIDDNGRTNKYCHNEDLAQKQGDGTYDNSKYGFSIQYPKDWKIELSDEDGFAKNSINPPSFYACQNENKEEVGEIACGSVSFGVVENPNKLGIEDFLKQEMGWTSEGDWRNLQKITVNGKNAYKLIARSGFDGSDSEHFWIPLNDGSFFEISGSYLSKSESEEVEKIFHTFNDQK